MIQNDINYADTDSAFFHTAELVRTVVDEEGA